jgi:Ca2+:H+ antiporter
MLLRDTIHAVVMLVVQGIAGLCVGVGALRHREQQFRTSGAQAYLIVLLPLVAISLVLPNFATSAPGQYYTNAQLASRGAVLLALSFIVALVAYGTDRASLLSGLVHLSLLTIWLFLLVVPCVQSERRAAESEPVADSTAALQT